MYFYFTLVSCFVRLFGRCNQLSIIYSLTNSCSNITQISCHLAKLAGDILPTVARLPFSIPSIHLQQRVAAKKVSEEEAEHTVRTEPVRKKEAEEEELPEDRAKVAVEEGTCPSLPPKE